MDTDVLDMVYEEEATKQVNLTDQEKSYEEIAQTAGAIRMNEFYGKFSNALTARMLHKAKVSKDYKQFGTWEQFCNKCGLSRSKADELLRTIKKLGESAYMALHDLRLKEKDIIFISNHQKAIEHVATDEGEIIEITLEDDKKIKLDKNNPTEIKEWIESAVKTSKETKEAAEQAIKEIKEKTDAVIKENAAKQAELEKELSKFKPGNDNQVLMDSWDEWQKAGEKICMQFFSLWNLSVKAKNPDLLSKGHSMYASFNAYFEDMYAKISSIDDDTDE